MTRPTPPAQDLYADAVGIGINPSWLAQFLGILEAMTKEGYWESNQYHGTNQVESFMKLLCDRRLPRMEIGQIIMMIQTNNYPDYLLPCEGQTLSALEYPDLYDVIDIAYKYFPGYFFHLPDFRGRAPFGAGTGTAGSLSMAQEGGAQTVTLDINQIPAHNHTFPMRAGSSGSGYGILDSVNATSSGYPITQNKGGGQAHNNMPPYHAIAFYIVAKNPS